MPKTKYLKVVKSRRKYHTLGEEGELYEKFKPIYGCTRTSKSLKKLL